MRLMAALLAAFGVITGLSLALPIEQGGDLERVGAAVAEAPGTASLTSALDRPLADGSRSLSREQAAGAPSAAIRQAEGEQDPLPLEVTMTGLSSATVPQGRLVVRGTITNRSDETWTDLNVYACSSGQPVTTRHDLAHAAAATTQDVVCGRTSVFTAIDEITPGDSASYTLRIPRDKLGIGERTGAYWFGVQVLGSSSAGRDAVADGTIRTFLPKVDSDRARRGKASFALALPFRGRTLHQEDGKLAAATTWASYVGPGGRLANMLTLAEAAPPGEASLLVDPAVLVAVQQLAAGNPGRGLGAEVPAEPTDGQSESEQPDTSEEDEETPPANGDPVAAAWLTRFVAVAGRLPVLALPYGDLDVAGAARHDPAALLRARQLSEDVLAGLGIQATAVIAPPNGIVSEEVRELAGGARVIVSSAMLPAPLTEGESIPTTVTVAGQTLHVSDASVSLGGPSPTNPYDAIALRQRLLAEAVVRGGEAAGGVADPALVVLPWDADPGRTMHDFFGELDRPWLSLRAPFGLTPTDVTLDGLDYPASQLSREIDDASFEEAERLSDLGSALDRLLPENEGLAVAADREAMSGTSYFAREPSLESAGLRDDTARRAVQASAAWFADQIAGVDVAVPRFVILGSTEGPFAMTVTNALDRPVRIGVRATTSAGLSIKAPKTIEVPPTSSRTVNLVAETRQSGVHSLTVVITDIDGRALRKSETISIRSRDVGWLIWVIMGVGATILFGAITVRLRKRRRAFRAQAAAHTAPARPAIDADPEDR